jgi:hypothetical protein
MALGLPGRVVAARIDALAVEVEEALQKEREPQQTEDASARAAEDVC